jgi:hypothetical protein
VSEEFVAIYQELLEDLPDEVLIKAVRECLLRCRFYPTIAEIRERAEPILQEWNLEHQRLIEANAYALCPESVWWDREKNTPHCRIEESDNPGRCQLAGTGRCEKFSNKYRDKGDGHA